MAAADQNRHGVSYLNLAGLLAEVGHGNFLPWIEANCEFTPMMA
jgi:hypothetical protein